MSIGIKRMIKKSRMVLVGLFCGILVTVSASSAIAEPKGANNVKTPADKPTPKLVGEKVIMTLDDTIGVGRNRGMSMMCLSPDRRRVLYLRKKICKSIIRPDGKPSDRLGYKLILRDLKTGKDTPVPVPAFFNDNYAVMYLSMTPFDPTGTTLVVPVGQDTNNNDFMDYETEKSKVGLYDIASGRLTILEIESEWTLPSFSPDGKNLVVLTVINNGSPPVKLFVTPTDKIKFRKLSHAGMPFRICPTSSLMPMSPVTDEKLGKFVLYDLKADVTKFDLTDKAPNPEMFYRDPQWTADGRYLYLATVKREARHGQTHSETQTGVWDVKAGKEVSILPGLTPVNPGPGKTTMVLVKRPMLQNPFAKSQPAVQPNQQIVLHFQGDKKLYPLGDKTMCPIGTRGKWLLYIRIGADGKKKVCLAEIGL